MMKRYEMSPQDLFMVHKKRTDESVNFKNIVKECISNFSIYKMYLIAYSLRHVESSRSLKIAGRDVLDIVYSSNIIEDPEKVFLLTLFKFAGFQTNLITMDEIFMNSDDLVYTAAIFLDKTEFVDKRERSRRLVLDAIKFDCCKMFRLFVENVKMEEYFLEYCIDNLNTWAFKWFVRYSYKKLSYRLMDRLIFLMKLFHKSELDELVRLMVNMLLIALSFQSLDMYQLSTIKRFNENVWKIVTDKNGECEKSLKNNLFSVAIYEDNDLSFCFPSKDFSRLTKTRINPVNGSRIPNHVIETMKNCEQIMNKSFKSCRSLCKNLAKERTKESEYLYEQFLRLQRVRENELSYEFLQEIMNKTFDEAYIVLDVESLKHSVISVARELYGCE
jgi:hypothetical protein